MWMYIILTAVIFFFLGVWQGRCLKKDKPPVGTLEILDTGIGEWDDPNLFLVLDESVETIQNEPDVRFYVKKIHAPRK